jgi:hypothetical protein
MKELFCVGDRVVCVAHMGEATRRHVGRCGTVKRELARLDGGYYIGVEFDEDIFSGAELQIGHNLDGYIETRRGWYCLPDELEFLQSEAACSVEDLL